MTPRPDHGETSYRGSGRLAGRRDRQAVLAAPRGAAAPRARTREGESVCNPGRFVTASRPFMRQEAPDSPYKSHTTIPTTHTLSVSRIGRKHTSLR